MKSIRETDSIFISSLHQCKNLYFMRVELEDSGRDGAEDPRLSDYDALAVECDSRKIRLEKVCTASR